MKISSRLPEDHGLVAIAAKLVTDPLLPRLAVVELDCIKVTTDTATGEQIPTARIRRVEAAVDDITTEHLRRYLESLGDVRTGARPLFATGLDSDR